MSELICPKCRGAMRQYERGGVTVDQCLECRGIFLDRGELDRLVDAENRWHGGGRPEAPYRPHGSGGRHDYGSGGRYDYGSGGGYRQGYGGYKKRRKKSFLDDLFD